MSETSPTSTADSSVSDIPSDTKKGPPVLQRPGWPRRPGSYPPNYPLDRILAEDPTPGQPLQLQRASPEPEAAPPSDSEPTFTRRVIDHRQTAIGQRPRLSRIISAISNFESLEGATPPPFKAKGWRYPSGKPVGTYLCQSFETQLHNLELGKPT